jgi:preprotein translocase subunit SecA
MYPFFAARFLEGIPADTLGSRVLEHLEGARSAVELSVGSAEIHRLGTTRMGEVDPRVHAHLVQQLGPERLHEVAAVTALDLREDREVAGALGRAVLSEAYRSLILSVGDRAWVEYLTQMEALRTSIGLEAYGQRDPLVQYKSRAFDMFQQLLIEIRAGVVSRMFRFQVRPSQPQAATDSRLDGAGTPPLGAPSSSGPESDEEAGRKRRRRRRHR